MDQMPRELQFSHDNAQFRAIFVDNIQGSSLSDEPCCICGYELNNLAYYTTEPPLFHAHVACALHHPDLHDAVAKIPSPEIRNRGLFSNLFPSSYNQYNTPNSYSPCAPSPSYYDPVHAFAYHCPANYYVSNVYDQNAPPSYNFPNNYHHGNESSSGKIMGAVAKGALRVFLQVLVVTIVAVVL